MKVLVLGGSAFNGRSLVDVLARAGHEVTVCNRGRTPVELPAGVATLRADRTDHAELRSVLGGREWDAVVDMTAYHPEDAELAIELFENRVGHYVFVSSMVTYATPTPEHPGPIDESHPDDRSENQWEYGLHKLDCEALLFEAHRERGFPATTVPLGMVFGPHNVLPGREQRMFARFQLGRPVLVPGDGSTVTVVGYAEDQGEAIEAILGLEASFGKRFNLTGDDPVSDASYVEAFRRVTGGSSPIVQVPKALMDDLWDKRVPFTMPEEDGPTIDIRPTPDGISRVIPHIHKNPLSNLIQRIQPSIHRWDTDVVFSAERLKALTGWKPRYDFAAMVEATYAWWCETDLLETQRRDWRYEDEILEMVKGR